MSAVTDIYRSMILQHVTPEHVVKLVEGHIADLRKLPSTDEIDMAIVELEEFVNEISDGETSRDI